ncbi:MAG: FAD-binding oxidoreductase [Gammaproteobacteria bacterium]|nr:FAD-binding oxidoreductase [Gammaproteobacteria bacterium]
MSDQSIAIIGAGIIGASTALALQQDGHRVTLLDRQEPCAGASFGNAGLIVNGSCAPTAMPGIVRDGLRMLARPLSALSVRPAYFMKILPWLIRFAAESRRSNVLRNARHLHALTNRAIDSWKQLTKSTQLGRLLESGGWIKVYETEQSFAATTNARALMDDNGTPYEILTAADIQDLEPQLAPIFERGIYQSDSLWLSNPDQMVRSMVDLLQSRGGTYRQFDVHSIRVEDDSVRLSNPDGSTSFDKVVVATGAWSKPLCQQLGDKVSLDTERGYHLMLSTDTRNLLTRPVFNGDSSFVLSPMEQGLRLTTQIEFAGLDAAPDYRRVRSLLPTARRMLPGIDAAESSVWMGCRPSLPDSLPVLGFASASQNVLYAFGHQHLGITLGPVTGLIIADLIAGRDPGIDLEPYKASRF